MSTYGYSYYRCIRTRPTGVTRPSVHMRTPPTPSPSPHTTVVGSTAAYRYRYIQHVVRRYSKYSILLVHHKSELDGGARLLRDEWRSALSGARALSMNRRGNLFASLDVEEQPQAAAAQSSSSAHVPQPSVKVKVNLPGPSFGPSPYYPSGPSRCSRRTRYHGTGLPGPPSVLSLRKGQLRTTQRRSASTTRERHYPSSSRFTGRHRQDTQYTGHPNAGLHAINRTTGILQPALVALAQLSRPETTARTCAPCQLHSSSWGRSPLGPSRSRSLAGLLHRNKSARSLVAASGAPLPTQCPLSQAVPYVPTPTWCSSTSHSWVGRIISRLFWWGLSL